MDDIGPGRRYRLVVADDNEDVLTELVKLLDGTFEIVNSVRDGIALVRATAALRPDAVVSDIFMTWLDGITAGTQIVRDKLCDSVILLTMHHDPALTELASQAGIRGFVMKEDAGEELVAAIMAVIKGGSYLSRSAV